MVGSQTARLLNVSELAAPLALSRPTVRDYVTLLERIFLVEELPPWHGNRLSRLVKTPKVHLGDSGLACALLGLDAEALAADRATLGQLLETFVVQELRRLASGLAGRVDFLHYRDRDGAEVDVVLERGPRELAGVEVKAGATVTASDFRGLRKLQESAGSRFKAGVVLYDGEAAPRRAAAAPLGGVGPYSCRSPQPVIVTPVIFVPPWMPIAAPRAARAAWAWPESMDLVSRLCSAATSAARSWVLRSTSLDGGGTVPSPPPPQPRRLSPGRWPPGERSEGVLANGSRGG